MRPVSRGESPACAWAAGSNRRDPHSGSNFISAALRPIRRPPQPIPSGSPDCRSDPSGRRGAGKIGARIDPQAADTEQAMAGHSQFKNIMHRKGRQDAVKSKLFGKLAREITVSAKMGLPDPTMNARLRAAIIAARAENMSKDSIERAIKKATGSEAESYDEIRYEGYGPG